MFKTKTALILALFALAGAAALRVSAPDEPILAETGFGTVVCDSRGDILRLGLAPDDKYRLAVKLDEIAPEAVAAALEYEDRHFYRHPGVNPFSLARAVFSLAGGGRRVGGSTITMQVARLRYGLVTNNFAGKFRQIWLALAMELRHSKREILEAYFNLAPYGGNIEGIEAASRVYFHKPASRLTGSEAAALAVVPQNPKSRNPVSGKDFGKARRRLEANPAPLQVYAPGDLPFLAPHLALELTAAGPAGNIRTNIERDLQKRLEMSLKGYAERGRRLGLVNASALILRWTDMRVCGLAGSADFNSAAISGQIDGTRARRSPGSTLKPFIYALGLDQGLIHPLSILPDSPRSFGGYDPGNFDREFRGPIPAGEALRASRNLPAIHLAEKLKNPDLYGLLTNANVKLKHTAGHYGLALALGGAEMTMRELASLYATLANQGLWRRPRLEAAEAAGAPVRLFSPEAAWLTLEMLRRPEAVVGSGPELVPYYYKTGTSNGMRDAWTAGIVGEYVLVVWLGNFDNRANPNLVGATAALPLFEELARSLAAMRKLAPLRQAPDLNLARAAICAATGDVFLGQCENVESVSLIPGVSPTRQSGIIRKILIDEASGLRACRPGPATRATWHEFWPSDMAKIFAAAGVHKPDPPAWAPGCGEQDSGSKPPRIVLPKKNAAYQKRAGDDSFRLPLQASADADAGNIHWYAGSRYLGSARPGETIYWKAPAGLQKITAVDDSGKSAKRDCRIMTLP